MNKLILSICTPFLFVGCNYNMDKSIIDVEKSPPTFTLKSEIYTSTIELTGNIKAKKHIPITSKITGRIDRLLVDVGDRVKKGQILARYSALDNENQIAYQNAIQSVRATKVSSANSIKSAEIQLETTKKALSQVEKEQLIAVKKTFDSLVIETQNTKTILSNTIGFLDQTIGVSTRFRGTNTNSIGNQNIIGKQNLKNKISQLVREFSIISKESKVTNYDLILLRAKEILSFLQKVKQATSDFDALVRGTTVTASFSEAVKQSWQVKSENFSSQIDSQIALLKNGINATKVEKEKSQLQILSAKNQVENSQSELSLSTSVAQNQIISAQSQLNLASNFQQELVVKAPFSGIITQKLIDQGQLVTPGQTFFKLADISGFKIETNIPDNQLQNISLETEVQIQVDGLDENFTGKITKINPSVDTTTRKIGIEITLDDKNIDLLKIGLFARVSFKGNEKLVFFVPKSFIHYGFDQSTILLESGEEKIVSLGSEKNNKIAITFDGITENLKIKP